MITPDKRRLPHYRGLGGKLPHYWGPGGRLIALALLAAAFSTGSAAHATVGATTPFISYEAEAGTPGGGASVVSLTAPPTTQYASPQLEASGHAFVQLTGLGQSVSWTNNTGQNVNFVNVRYSIPDAPTGGGIAATLDLYIDGQFRQAINMNSRQTWQYEGNNHYSNPSQSPADGNPINFWDDTSAFVTGAAIAPGSVITLQVDSANTAQFYDIDVVDVENPPAPLTQPANSLSIADYGAVADNNPTNGAADPGAPDSYSAIQNCINDAAAQGKIVWIPQGTFYVNGTNGLQATGVTIQGAGMWYSKIYRNVPLPNNTPLGALFQVISCHVSNFACDTNSMSRNMVDAGGGAMDTTGTNWTADSIWTEHAESGFWASGTGGTISNCRLISIFADGANINNVSMGNTVGNNITERNNFVRGTGDDGIAINSVHDNGGTQTYSPMQNCTFVNNTVIAPWGGKCLAVYGGSGHLVQNNYGSDTARYIGLGAGRFGVNGSDLLSATITGNVIVRCGGNGYNQGQPAMHIGNGGDGQSVGIVQNVTATGNTIINSVFDAIGFSTGSNIDVESNTIQSPWRNGVVVQPPFSSNVTGSATVKNNTLTGLPTAALPFINHASGYTVTQSGNTWNQSPYAGAPYGGTAASIPGTIQSENYDTGGYAVGYFDSDTTNSGGQYRTDGVDIEACSDTGGGYDIGWTNGGEWLNYTVNVATPGVYNVSFRVASGSATGSTAGSFHLLDVNGNNLAAVNVPGTGGWQTWTTVTATVTLPAGLQVLEISEDTGNYNLNSMSFAAGEAPYGGTPWPIPGTIESENYDTGGEGLAYHDTDVTNNGGQYRTSEAVDVENCGDTGGGYDVGWNFGGEWQNYTVNVSTAGTYAVTFRVANGTGGNGSFHLQSAGGANLTGTVTVPVTASWQTYINVTANVVLPAGPQIMTLNDDGGDYNVNYMTFAQVTVPGAPTGLAAAAGNTQVGLSWTGSTGATSYNVYRGTAAGGEGATPVAAGVTSTSYTDTGLTNGTTYYYTVAAVDAAGTSTASNEASATPQPPAPAAPMGLTATAGISQVTLSWTASTGATSYNVYRGTTAGGETTTPIATGLTSTSFTNTALTNGTTYYYTVVAINGGGSSAASNEASATPQPAVPLAPTGLTATAGVNQAALSWSTSTGATSYNVYRGTTAGSESTTPVATGVTATSYTNTGLTNGTTYYFTVKAVNGGGSSPASNEANATPQPTAPAAPTGLIATGGVTQISLSWTASSGATSYNVYRGTTAGGESATPIVTGVTSTSYTSTGLTSGTTYYFTVKAVNGGGSSTASTEANATPEAVTAYNINGIDTVGTASTNGGFDKTSGNALDTAQLGSSITWNGQLFTFGPANAPDCWSNLTVNYSRTGGTLYVLAAAANGNQTNQSFLVTFTDGTKSTFTQSISDWFTPQNYAGESRAITMADRLTSTGAKDNRTYYLYGYSFALPSGKTIKYVKLPTTRNVVVVGIGVH